MTDGLEPLLIGAIEAPPAHREQYKDPIARHGGRAILRLLSWISHPDLAQFAVETIARAADFGARAEARDALRLVLQTEQPADLRAVVDTELQRTERKAASVEPGMGAGAGTRSLVRGQRYRRRDLHRAGLGGNWQKGISYPAHGDYVLLFSAGKSRDEFGYEDRWESEDVFQYFGEWAGPGPMVLDWGNRQVIERSPNLYLFTFDPPDYVFQGRFAYIGHHFQPARRDSNEFQAIVFRLRRVASEVSL